jgi:hypothetical protein
MKDTKTGQTMPGKQADCDENTQRHSAIEKVGAQKQGSRTDQKEFSPGKGKESTEKSEKIKIGFSQENEEDGDQELKTVEEQDEDNEEFEPARRVKTPIAGREFPNTDRKR